MLIVGIGGTFRTDSSTEGALRICLEESERHGVKTQLVGGDALMALPIYRPGVAAHSKEAALLLDAVSVADGLVIASPGYHGTVSGLVKNALDYIEELSGSEPPYLTDMPVGCVATARGPQAAEGTLATLRLIVHALRGYPTPYGAGVIVEPDTFTDGRCTNDRIRGQLALVGEQVALMVTSKLASGSTANAT